MGRWHWHWDGWGWFPCRKGSYSPTHEEINLRPYPKPIEADVTDDVPYIDSEKEIDILIVRKIEPCVAINGALHHTSKYELMNRDQDSSLVIRRGQPFRIDLHLSRPYREDTDGISFIFTVDDEDRPSYGQRTLIAIPLLQKESRSLWNAVLETSFENRITVQITTAADCVVAKWKLDVDTKILNLGAYSFSWPTPIYILFNAWCRDDQVHLKSDAWKEEAVLDDVGLIWRGTTNRLRPCIWKYAQFEKHILECSLYLIKHVGKVNGQARGDPVETTRAIAASVNSSDDDGAVVGNWSMPFEDGTAPTEWIGSMEILQKYYKKKEPVKYGQCWVFAGVVTTICRSIGIPSRPVTNYSSAHDTQGSLTVDYYMDEKGKIMEELNSDSIWNFHVWNEAWMERPDLGEKYGGWQAIDATPQESSDNMFRCGPASLVAVKAGEVKRPYDTSFVFAEVNADLVFWKYDGLIQPLKLLRKDIYFIGKLITTKAAGKFELEDITLMYKHAEKSEEERDTMFKALKQSGNKFARFYLNEHFNDIHFNFELLDDITIGQPFNVTLIMTNNSKENDYRVEVDLFVEVVTYRGKVGDRVKEKKFTVMIDKKSKQELKLNLTYDEYSKRILDQASFRITCLAKVDNTNYEYFAEDDFRVRKPDVKINLQDSAFEDVECKAMVYLTNPLPVALRKAMFKVEAPGLSEVYKVKEKIPPGEKVLVEFVFTPKKYGKHTIAAKFASKELDDCDGYHTFWVNFKEESNEIE